MDVEKCHALKVDLMASHHSQIFSEGQPNSWAVSIDRFFDGNDDEASIGCNLSEHPGLATFRTVLTDLLLRPDVDAIFVQISEINPGEDFWPFADIVFVVGAISLTELRNAVATLQPGDIFVVSRDQVAKSIVERHDGPVSGIWWD